MAWLGLNVDNTAMRPAEPLPPDGSVAVISVGLHDVGASGYVPELSVI